MFDCAQITLDVNSLKSEMRTGFAVTKGDMDVGFAKIDASLNGMKVDMDVGFAKIDAKLDACDLKLSGTVDQLGKLDAKFDKLLEELARIK